MIGIGPVLIIIGVYAIIGIYLAVIHRALHSSEVDESEAKLTFNRKSEGTLRTKTGQPEQTAGLMPMRS